MATTHSRRVVLVGAGHAHVQVLESWAAKIPIGATLTVVSDAPRATYSGMVPGVVAGDYRSEDAEIPVEPLARRAGAAFVPGRALRVDPVERRIDLQGGASIAYDLASLDVGSTVRGLDLPGVAVHALATRPIGTFAAAFEERVGLLAARGRAGARVLVVGGGAAGIELAFTIRARLASMGLAPAVTVACGSDGLLRAYPERVRRLVRREAARAGISIAGSADATLVDERGVGFDDGRLDADLVVWATGPAPVALLSASPLPRDTRGYVLVEDTFEVCGHRGLFAAGDCASIRGNPSVAKAGVYAVRAGPVLDANLRAFVAGEALRPFRPQRDFLTLLNLGGRRALATKWGFAFTGPLAWTLKDRIDRGFVARFVRAAD